LCGCMSKTMSALKERNMVIHMSWKKPMFDVDKLRDLYNALKVYAIYNDRCWIFDAFEAFDPRVAEMHFENILLLINGYPGEASELLSILHRYASYARQIYGGMDRGELVKVIKVEVDKAIAWFLNYLRERGWTEGYVKEKEARSYRSKGRSLSTSSTAGYAAALS